MDHRRNLLPVAAGTTGRADSPGCPARWLAVWLALVVSGSTLPGSVLAQPSPYAHSGYPGGAHASGGDRQFRPGIKQIAPVLESLPPVGFAEDDSSFVLFSSWYPYVDDVDDADATLIWDVQPTANLTASATVNGVILGARPDWFGTDSVRVIVRDPLDLADTAYCRVTVTPVNDLPRVFDLIEPPENAALPPGIPILFRWRAAVDVDQDPLEYELWILSGAGNQSHDADDDTTYTLDSLAVRSDYLWYVVAHDAGGSTSSRDTLPFSVLPRVGVEGEAAPRSFHLYPIGLIAGGRATVQFDLPMPSDVSLQIFDVSGREIMTPLMRDRRPAGTHSVHLSMSRLSSGIYFLRLSARADGRSFGDTRKVLLTR